MQKTDKFRPDNIMVSFRDEKKYNKKTGFNTRF